MSFKDTIKGLIFKKPAPGAERDARDPRRSNEPMKGGRRAGEAENPYLAARRTWNDHVGSVVSQRQTWQVIGILSLMIALAADKADQRVVHASVSEFINDARIVTPDVALQRKAVFRVYAKLAPNDPATAKMNEWLNGSEDASPFKRAAKEMVSVEIKSVLPQTADTWQVDWVETTRDRQGTVKGLPVTMRPLVTTYAADTTPQTTDEQLRNNPMSIYVRDFSWSRLQ